MEGRKWQPRGSEWRHGDSWQPLTFKELENEREDQRQVVLSPEYRETVDRLIDYDQLTRLFEETWSAVRQRVQDAEAPERKFLYHTDPKPENFWFPGPEEDESPAIVIDYDLAKITHNQPLAQLIDYGLFYAKASANKSMQQEFLATILQDTPPEGREETYQLLRAAVLYGTMLSTKFSLLEDKDRPFEERRAVPLLANLQNNLEKLRKSYETSQAKFPGAEEKGLKE